MTGLGIKSLVLLVLLHLKENVTNSITDFYYILSTLELSFFFAHLQVLISACLLTVCCFS